MTSPLCTSRVSLSVSAHYMLHALDICCNTLRLSRLYAVLLAYCYMHMLYTNQATCPAYSTFLDIRILTESKQQCTRKYSKYWVSFILFTQFHSFQDVRADGNHGKLFSICVLCDSFGGVILERQRERERQGVTPEPFKAQR